MSKWNRKNPRFKKPSSKQRKKNSEGGILSAISSRIANFTKITGGKKNTDSPKASNKNAENNQPDGSDFIIPRPSPKDSELLRQSSVLKTPAHQAGTEKDKLGVKVSNTLYEEYSTVIVDNEVLEAPKYLDDISNDSIGMSPGYRDHDPLAPDVSHIITVNEITHSSDKEFMATVTPEDTHLADQTGDQAPASADNKGKPGKSTSNEAPVYTQQKNVEELKAKKAKRIPSYTVVEKASPLPRTKTEKLPSPTKEAKISTKQGKKKHPRPLEDSVFNRRPPLWRVISLVIAGFLIIAFTLLQLPNFLKQHYGETEVPDSRLSTLPELPTLIPGPFEYYATLKQQQLVSEVVIKKGDTLGKALEELNLGPSVNRSALIKCLTEDVGIQTLHLNSILRVFWEDESRNKLIHLEYQRNTNDRPIIIRPNHNNDGFWFYNLSAPPIKITAAKEGIVNSSLWEAGVEAGLDPNLIISFADIMASVIDFVTDIKKGDSFQILFSREYVDGIPQGQAHIEMVRMSVNKTDYEFYHYIDSKGEAGYYDDKGRSSKKAFFVSPLQYKRISSRFTMRRLHPIFKTIRPHQGVDYAAPSGTPVSTVADGTVIFAGWNGGYGKLITVKHNQTYTTMYAHLERFAGGISKGAKVKQGDVIGYVGATGTATGPHLDFRIKQNGTFVDPIPTLAKQEGKELEPADKQAFTTILTQTRNRMAAYLSAERQNEKFSAN